MNKQVFVLSVLFLSTVLVYLFATAPPPLADEVATSGNAIPIESVMRAVAAENDVARALYTKEIVGAGLKAGLEFEEEWQNPSIEAGPLPALFLRSTAASLERNPIPLSLFLGSPYPINASNQFNGAQSGFYDKILADGEPQFFYDDDIERHTAMFADKAVATACVTCHNDHADSPKKDWVLGEVMGATTWSYPDEAVNLESYLRILAGLRKGFRDTYQAYLDKTKTFANPPEIGDLWPKDGNYLPSADVFMDEIVRRSSVNSLHYGMEALSAQ